MVEAARAPEAAVERAQAKLGQEVAAARARETRAVAVARQRWRVVGEGGGGGSGSGTAGAWWRRWGGLRQPRQRWWRRGWLLSLRRGQNRQDEQH